MIAAHDYDILSQLLTGVVEQLDIPPAIYQLASDRYTALGAHLARYADERGGADWAIYPQGSFRLGTVVRPLSNDEYDVDLVCVHGVDKTSVTQAALKQLVGAALDTYAEADGLHAPDSIDEGKRCWTLGYDGKFHMDVLPALPRTDSKTGILLTDIGYHRWLESDPIGYANWFRRVMQTEWDSARVALAKEARSTVEAVPEWSVRTTLQRGVQVLKRHRDIFFREMPDLRPPSILVTTLAAKTYQGTGSVFALVRRASIEMTSHIENRDGVLWVPNPVCPTENFADRWTTNRMAYDKFIEWLDSLSRDLASVDGAVGMDTIITKLAAGLGRDEVRRAAETMGGQTRVARETGKLAMAASGALAVGGTGRPVPNHQFFGHETRR